MGLNNISAKTGLRMILGGFSSLLVLMECLLRMRSHEHGHHFPGFLLVFGVLGAIVLALAAKLIIFPLLKRDEDYYTGDRS